MPQNANQANMYLLNGLYVPLGAGELSFLPSKTVWKMKMYHGAAIASGSFNCYLMIEINSFKYAANAITKTLIHVEFNFVDRTCDWRINHNIRPLIDA